MPVTYAAVCIHCRAIVVSGVARLRDEEMRKLTEHVRTRHPDEIARQEAVGVADVLLNFRITAE